MGTLVVAALLVSLFVNLVLGRRLRQLRRRYVTLRGVHDRATRDLGALVAERDRALMTRLPAAPPPSGGIAPSAAPPRAAAPPAA